MSRSSRAFVHALEVQRKNAKREVRAPAAARVCAGVGKRVAAEAIARPALVVVLAPLVEDEQLRRDDVLTEFTPAARRLAR